MKQDLEAIKQKIDSLDLEPIKFKLVEESGWSRDFANSMETAYKGFLFLNAKYPGFGMTPSKSLDEIWHTHILDTEKYAEDCDKLFGKFLHHFPYLGMRGKEDQALMQENFSATKELFQKELGINIDVSVNDTAATCYGKCGNTNCQKSGAPLQTKVRPQFS
jgi:hypothetical protein